MTKSQLFQVAGLLLVASLSQLVIGTASRRVTVSMDPLIAMPGDEVIYECQIEGLQIGDLVYTYKEVLKESGEPALERIATNGVVTPFYNRTYPKFSVKLSMVNNIATVRMTIKGVNSEDTGYYGCYLAKTADKDKQLLQVYKPHSWAAISNLTAGEHLMLREKREILTFDLYNTCPEPTITMAIGDEDFTDCVSTNSLINVQCQGSLGTKTCPVYFDYDLMSKCSLLIDKSYDLQPLTFTARYPHPEVNETKSFSNFLSVLYEPEADCEHLHVESSEGGKVSFSCRVDSNPMPHYVVWEFTTLDGQKHKIETGQLDHVFSPRQETLDNRTTLVGLNINEVKPIHYTTYKLIVRNSEGDTSETFELTEEKLATTTVGSHAANVQGQFHLYTMLTIVSLCRVFKSFL